MKFRDARALAECWIGAHSQGEAIIDQKWTATLPYGWVFFWNSQAFIADPANHRNAIFGNVPILIDRINGELRVLGPAHWEEHLRQLEGSFPKSWFEMTPEPPQW